MQISVPEYILSLMLVVIGIIQNLRLYRNKAQKVRQIRWSFMIYGAAIIVLICGSFTPPDILTNLVLSVPLFLIYALKLIAFLPPSKAPN